MHESYDHGCATRREFLRTGCLAAGAIAGFVPGQLFAGPVRPNSKASITRLSENRSKVFRISSNKLVSGRIVQPMLLREAIDVGLCGLTNQENVNDAWHQILKPEDVILLKFNQSGASVIGTSPALAVELVGSLVDAGWPPSQIMLLEVEPASSAEHKTLRPDLRWQAEEIEFGSSGKDVFLAALDQATALINVPFVKTHHLATMTCSLKNLSHGLIRHPAQFHGNGCGPAIAEICASHPIRSKLRLNIVDAMRPVFNHGPDAQESDIHEAGALLFGMDGVACDAVAFSILNATRSLRQLQPLLPNARIPDYLALASHRGLGVADLDYIDIVSAEL